MQNIQFRGLEKALKESAYITIENVGFFTGYGELESIFECTVRKANTSSNLLAYTQSKDGVLFTLVTCSNQIIKESMPQEKIEDNEIQAIDELIRKRYTLQINYQNELYIFCIYKKEKGHSILIRSITSDDFKNGLIKVNNFLKSSNNRRDAISFLNSFDYMAHEKVYEYHRNLPRKRKVMPRFKSSGDF